MPGGESGSGGDRVRELEERADYFRALIETSRDTVSVADAEGKRLYLSPSFVELTGYQPAEVLGDSIFELVHPDDIETAREAYRRILEVGDQRLEVRFRHKAGGWRCVEILGRNLLGDPRVRGIVSTLRDITPRRELEQQLMQAQKMEAVGRLAGGIAHDFNNILMVIEANAEMLRGELPEGSGRELEIEQILEASQRAATFTRQLLAFSRRDVATPRVIDLRHVVEKMETMLRRIIGEDVTLTTQPSTEPCSVHADPGQMEQVLLNLAVNARDAMPRGGHLDIRCAPSGDGVTLTVSDDGDGMSEDVRARIFDPFFTTKRDGTGVGLSTVYGVIQRAGGRVQVETAPSEGTTFTVTLPRAQSVEPARQTPERGAQLPGGCETILVVEDEEGVRRSVKELLQRQGYRVLEADDGLTALDVMKEHDGALDLVLSDVVMASMSGPTLAERIAVTHPTLPVLFMSGHADDARFRHGAREGQSFRLLHKPFSAAALACAVRRALDTRGSDEDRSAAK